MEDFRLGPGEEGDEDSQIERKEVVDWVGMQRMQSNVDGSP